MTVVGFLERGPFAPNERLDPVAKSSGFAWGVAAAEDGIVALVADREDAFALAEILNRAYRKSLGARE